jgi:hypothetical protein
MLVSRKYAYKEVPKTSPQMASLLALVRTETTILKAKQHFTHVCFLLYTHCQNHSFCSRQVPSAQVVAPVQPMPPHCPHMLAPPPEAGGGVEGSEGTGAATGASEAVVEGATGDSEEGSGEEGLGGAVVESLALILPTPALARTLASTSEAAIAGAISEPLSWASRVRASAFSTEGRAPELPSSRLVSQARPRMEVQADPSTGK